MSLPLPGRAGTAPPIAEAELERALSRLLTIGTYLSVALLGVGVAAMLAAGRSPLDPGFEPLDPGRLPADLAAGRPEGFLWLGLIAVVATPLGRVGGALVGFVLRREAPFAAVAVGILGVIGAGLVLSLGAG